MDALFVLCILLFKLAAVVGPILFFAVLVQAIIALD